MAEKTVLIPKISCGHCVATIKREIGEIPGVTSIVGDPATKRVVFYWSSPASWVDIANVLAEIGYPPEE